MVYRAKRALFSVLGIRNYNYKGEGGGGGEEGGGGGGGGGG